MIEVKQTTQTMTWVRTQSGYHLSIVGTRSCTGNLLRWPCECVDAAAIAGVYVPRRKESLDRWGASIDRYLPTFYRFVAEDLLRMSHESEF